MPSPWTALKFSHYHLPTKTTQNRLPHWQQEGACYFITFRLHDSLPAVILRPWQHARAQWLTDHPEPWDPETEAAYYREFATAFDGFLDDGHGSCILRQPAPAAFLVQTLRHFDHNRYVIHSFVIMPNHVHILVSLAFGEDLEKNLASWKRFSANAIHQHQFQTTGQPHSGALWQKDYFDRMIRDETHFRRVINYIRRNPEKAQLREGEYLHYEAEWIPRRGDL